MHLVLYQAIRRKEQHQRLKKNFSLFDVYAADEAFVTGSFGGVTPVTKIDGRIIGKGKFGKLSKKLNHLYEQLIEEEITQKKVNARR